MHSCMIHIHGCLLALSCDVLVYIHTNFRDLYMKYPQSFFLSAILISITSCGGGGESAVPTSTPTPQNNAPSINAGNDLTVNENTSVNLSGSGSDSDGSISNYSWSQTSGTSVTLTNANSASATFISPSINTNEILTFKLVVTDDDGASANDSIDITVINTNADFPITEDNGNLVRYLPNDYIKYDWNITIPDGSAEGEKTISYSYSAEPLVLSDGTESLTMSESFISNNSADLSFASVTSYDVFQFPDIYIDSPSLEAYYFHEDGNRTTLNIIDGQANPLMLLVGSPYVGYYHNRTVTRKEVAPNPSGGTLSAEYSAFYEVDIPKIEIIDTPLGTFEAFKLERTVILTGNISTKTTVGSYWFHPAIGIVKARYDIITTDSDTISVEEMITSTNLNY